MLNYLFTQHRFLVSVFIVSVSLIIIDLISQDAWLFAISIVFVWPLEDKFYKGLCKLFVVEESPDPVGFLLYIITILVAAGAAYTIYQQFLLTFHVPTSENATSTATESLTTFLNATLTITSTSQNSNPFCPIGEGLVIGLSFLISAVAYFVVNFSQLNAEHGWIRKNADF